MSTELLRNYAGGLVKQASEIRSSYDTSKIRESALKSLQEADVDLEKSASILDSVLSSYKPEGADQMLQRAEELERNSDILIKAANLLDETQSKLEEKELELDNFVKSASLSPIVDRLKGNGYTEDEVNVLKSLPENLLTKVAEDHSPWEMGAASTKQTAGLDPIAQFVLN